MQDNSGDCRNKGVTLIELIVALAVLAVVAGVGITIFLSINQAYSKSVIIGKLRTEGTRVMEEMSRVIRSGTNLEGVSGTCSGSPPVCTGLHVDLNKNSLEYEQNGNCETVEFQLVGADAAHNNRITKAVTGGTECVSPIGAGVVTDDDRTTGVDVQNLEFTIIDGGGVYPDKVTINLKLGQGLDVPSRREYKAVVNLRETVSTRQY